MRRPPLPAVTPELAVAFDEAAEQARMGADPRAWRGAGQIRAFRPAASGEASSRGTLVQIAFAVTAAAGAAAIAFGLARWPSGAPQGPVPVPPPAAVVASVEPPTPPAPPPVAEKPNPMRAAGRPPRAPAPACGGGSCTYRHVLAADRRVRAAYRAAVRRGVPRAVLVEQRNRWARLQGAAARRPEVSVRRYAALERELASAARVRR